MNSRETVTTFTIVPSPIGPLLLSADDEGLSGLYTDAGTHKPPRSDAWRDDPKPFKDAIRQLAEYFTGKRRTFELPLHTSRGTAFERDVWSTLKTIPFGEVVSYTEVGVRAERPGAVRAIGAAVGRNPWGIIVPCHRVVGASGKMTGFAGGLARKRWLLEHEGVHVTAGKGVDDRGARAVPNDPSALRLF